jgi:hypothetical protein
MGFGSLISDKLSGFVGDTIQGFFGADSVKDYSHASKTFVADGYSLSPNNKYLFHVYFNLNTAGIPELADLLGTDKEKIGLLVKTVALPTYTIDIDEVNQYNRKRYIQKRIDYNPVEFAFHDDGSDLIRSMWYHYYNYYYHDSGYGYSLADDGSKNYAINDIYNNTRFSHDWGYSGRGLNSDTKPPFFLDISIYGLNRGNFVEYTLINPIISSWDHDTYDYSSTADTMQHRMTVNYETVKYARGKVAEGEKIRGFAHSSVYDTVPSSLSKPGTSASIFGQAGLLDAGAGIYSDLASGNILGAFQKGGSVLNTFNNADFGEILSTDLANEAITQGKAAISSLSGGIGRFPLGNSIPSFGEIKAGSILGTLTPLSNNNVVASNGSDVGANVNSSATQNIVNSTTENELSAFVNSI